ARRYALFTLVGIAGEDYLDAPDLDAASKTGVAEPPRSDHRNQSTSDAGIETWARDRAKLRVRSGAPVLTPDQSAMVRGRLLANLAATTQPVGAAAWARRNFPTKNPLTVGDAQFVKKNFQAIVLSTGDGKAPPEPCDPLSAKNVIPAD